MIPWALEKYIRAGLFFHFEDGHGNAVDDNGGPEPMDYIVDQDVTHGEYLKYAASNLHQLAQMLIGTPKDQDCNSTSTVARVLTSPLNQAGFRKFSSYQPKHQIKVCQKCLSAIVKTSLLELGQKFPVITLPVPSTTCL
ncbi:hypothetical protein BX666DRAFT_1852414 [Dichotomocladium elegans]|nr:hypothetical protein BX666DRAFT_1852414 [Dichotomocladium elegans]